MKANKLVLKFWNKFVKGNDAKRSATLPAVEDYESIENIEYMDDKHPLHTLNIYAPKGKMKEKMPVIIDIHGGGWYYGDKELNSWYCESLVRYGFKVVDLSYKVSPEVDFKGQIQDIYRAFEFVFNNAEKYELDLDKVTITGDSAGGHIVAIIANIESKVDLQEKYGVKPSLKIKAVCATCPALEPLEMVPFPIKFYFNPVFGKGYTKNEMKDMVSFRANFNKNICPMFFITCYGDFFKTQAREGYELLKKNGVKTDIYFGEKDKNSPNKLSHVFNILFWHWKESLEANKKMCDFFMDVLNG